MRIVAAIKLLALAVLAAVAIAACRGETNPPTDLGNRLHSQSSATPTDCRTIEHYMGKTEICGQPEKVVVLGSNFLELLLALGMQPAGFGDSPQFHLRDYDNPSQQIPYLGNRIDTQLANVGFAYEPSIEAILKVQPDLILGSHWLSQEYKTLSKIAPTLLFEWFEVDKNLRAIAQAVRSPEKAEELIAQRQQQIAAAREDFAPVVDAYPDVLMLMSSDSQNLALITYADNFCGSLIGDLGFKLVFPPGLNENDPGLTTPISSEILPKLNEADSVILLGYDPNNFHQRKVTENFEQHQLTTIEQTWKKNAIAQSLQASKTKRVYLIPAHLCLSLPGPFGTEIYLNELREQMLSPKRGEG